MATRTDELTQFLHDHAPSGEFRPCAYYDPDADALTFYFSNEPDYRQRLNSRVTIYLSEQTDELVGCRIKGVRSVLEDIGSFDVSISHGKVNLKVLFVALHGTFSTDADSRGVYRRLGEAIRQSDIELDVPTLAG